ncbi:IS1/IS1595 family N-terminal zinc-binding domain-containing protein, partial [Algoriphagus sp. oki45]
MKWGKQAGKQRYKCKNCGILFTGSNPSVARSNQFVWF